MTRIFYASKLIGAAAFGATQLLTFAGCSASADTPQAVEVPNLDGVVRLELRGRGELTLRQGAERLAVTTNEADQITIVRDGDVLRIDIDDVDETPRFDLSLPRLEGLDIAGSAHVRGDRLEVPELRIESSGASKIELTGLQVDVLTVDSSGASGFVLGGTAREQRVEVSGAADYDARALRANEVSVEAAGASRVRVFAIESLALDASGAGLIEYAGQPTVEQSVSGAFSIRHVGS